MGKRSVDVGEVKVNPPAADKKEVALLKPYGYKLAELYIAHFR
jgi:hypothetical protein